MNYESQKQTQRGRDLIRKFFEQRPDMYEKYREILVGPTEPEVQKIKRQLEQDQR